MTPPKIGGRSKERGPGATPHICGKKSKEVAKYNGNAASESLLVYTMSRAQGRKASFSEAKFKPPKCLFHFICFQLATYIS